MLLAAGVLCDALPDYAIAVPCLIIIKRKEYHKAAGAGNWNHVTYGSF